MGNTLGEDCIVVRRYFTRSWKNSINKDKTGMKHGRGLDLAPTSGKIPGLNKQKSSWPDNKKNPGRKSKSPGPKIKKAPGRKSKKP
jgi:hypothetical protein